jgi:hypothetical protein
VFRDGRQFYREQESRIRGAKKEMAEKPTTLPRKLAWKQEEDITQAVFSKRVAFQTPHLGNTPT